MAEASKPRAPRRKAAAPVRPTPVPAATNGGSTARWLELVGSLVQAPVVVGRDQAARLQSATDGLDRFIESRIEDVLNRVNIPSRSDIERLNRSVDVLTAKVEALLNRHDRGGN
jgi:hypothetical protein